MVVWGTCDSTVVKANTTILQRISLPVWNVTSLTESCPDRYWGASLSMLGLMGEVTEMDGRSIFWDSKELEPVEAQMTHLFRSLFIWSFGELGQVSGMVVRKAAREAEAQRQLCRRFSDYQGEMGEWHWLKIVNRLTRFQLCMCAVWYPWNISKNKKQKECEEGGNEEDQFQLSVV